MTAGGGRAAAGVGGARSAAAAASHLPYEEGVVSTGTRALGAAGGGLPYTDRGGEGRTPAAYLRRAGGEEVLVVGVLSRAPAHEPDARTNAGGSPGATRVSHGGGGSFLSWF